MEKTLRVLGGDDESGHTHSHSHSHAHPVSASDTVAVNGTTTALTSSDKDGLRPRHELSKSSNGEHAASTEPEKKGSTGPSVLSAYLNLFGDFVHNM